MVDAPVPGKRWRGGQKTRWKDSCKTEKMEQPPPVPCDEAEALPYLVCSTLKHSCEVWNLTRMVVHMINGFNSRCLHVITGEDYRTTATVPAYNLELAVRKRRLRYLGHVLRLPVESIVRRSLLALVKEGMQYPEGSLFSDCEAALPQLEALSLDHSAWRANVSSVT